MFSVNPKELIFRGKAISNTKMKAPKAKEKANNTFKEEPKRIIEAETITEQEKLDDGSYIV